MGVRRVALDSSVVLAWVLPDEPWHAQANAISADITAGLLDPVGASNLRFEVRHGLVRAVRRGRMDWDAVRAALVAIDAVSVGSPDIAYQDKDLLRLCRSHGIGWGDAHHAHLAARLEVPLLTADTRLVNAMRGSHVWVESIADRPV